MQTEARLASSDFHDSATKREGFVRRTMMHPYFMGLAASCPVPWIRPLEPERINPLQPMIVVRKCLLILMWQILLLEAVVLVAVVIGMYGLSDLFLTQKVMIAIAVIKLLVVFYLLANWKAGYYLITPEKIIQHSGVFSRVQEACAIKNIESIVLRQGILGKLFNFGTLKLYAPTLNHRIFMVNIHNPRKKMELIEKLTPKTQTRNLYNDDLMILPQQLQ